MTIRKLDPGDDITAAARLVYLTDPSFFPLLFGREEKAVTRIAKLIRLGDNSFAKRFIWRYGDVDGILIGHMPGDVDRRKEDADFRAVFPLPALLGFGLKYGLFVRTSMACADGAYIQNICVDTSKRGLGIGSALIEHYCDYARQCGQGAVYLDVGKRNTGARRLYERHGFAVVRGSALTSWISPVYRMKKEL